MASRLESVRVVAIESLLPFQILYFADIHKALTLKIAARIDRSRSDQFLESLSIHAIPPAGSDEFERQKVLLTPLEQLAEDALLIRHLDRYTEFYYWR